MNANDYAFPQHGWTSDPKTLERMATRQGLTIREHMATQAMEGIVACLRDPLIAEPISKLVACASVTYADALILELNKTP